MSVDYSEAILKGYCAAITKAVRRQCKDIQIVSDVSPRHFEIVFQPAIGGISISGTMTLSLDAVLVSVSPGNHCYSFKLQDPESLAKCKKCVKSVVGRWRSGLSEELMARFDDGTPVCWLKNFHPEKKR